MTAAKYLLPVPDRKQARSHRGNLRNAGGCPAGASLLALSTCTRPQLRPTQQKPDNAVIAGAARRPAFAPSGAEIVTDAHGARKPKRIARPRATAGTRHQRGLSILEFTLVVSIFSALIVFAANRITELRVDLERAAIEHTLAGMRSALALKSSELLIQGKHELIAEWAGGNPLELFEHRRALESEAGGTPGPGEWSYDREQGEIVYRPAYPAALTGDPDAIGRWRVVVPGEEEPRGLELTIVQPLPGIGRAKGEN